MFIYYCGLSSEQIVDVKTFFGENWKVKLRNISDNEARLDVNLVNS